MELTSSGSDLLGHAEAALLRALDRLTSGVSGREAARLARLPSQSTARRALLHLTRIGLVTAIESSHATLYSVNRRHVLWGAVHDVLLAPARIERLIADIVSRHLGTSTSAALFGSVARGEAHSLSDIDLLLVVPDSTSSESREAVIDELHAEVTPFTGNPVQVFIVSVSQLAAMVRADDQLVESWRADARTISGDDVEVLLQRAAA